MKAIPRKDWTPSCHSIVCSRHFNEEDFITSTRDSNDRRKTKSGNSSRFSEAIPGEERNSDYLRWVAFLFKQEKGRQSVKNYLFCRSETYGIQKRFGWYCQLSGADYFLSVRQVLEAEKSIRIKSLVKQSDTKIIDAASAMVPIESLENVLTPIMEELLSILNSDDLLNEYEDVADKNIIFYVAGYIPRSVRRVEIHRL